jgi:hypothetical protein
MELKRIKKSASQVLAIDGAEVLLSYGTPVAYSGPDGVFRTDKQWSPTTSKHINQWAGYKPKNTKPQSWFNALISIRLNRPDSQ